MSLILEALRKSEADRRRGEAPSLHRELPPTPRVQRPSLHWIAGWVALALAVLLSAWGVLAWLSPRSSLPSDARTPSHDVGSEPRTAGAPAGSSPRAALPPVALPPVRHLTQPAILRAPAVAKATPPEQQVEQTAPWPTTPAAIQPPPATPPRDDAMALSDLDPQLRKALPPLKLSMHMWNDDPSQRFVILDGNRLREGDRISDAVVTAITRDGVVLDWNGRKLKLPIR